MSETFERTRLGNLRIDAENLRGECPNCGQAVVSNAYYVQGRGYIVYWECVGFLKEQPTCIYRRVL